MSKPRIIYIASVGHSGSTLLDVLIGSHDDVFSVGEITNLNPRRVTTTNCSCGSAARRILTCPFWIEVGETMQRNHGIGLREIDLASSDPGIFDAHHVALYQTLQRQTGKSIFVDSSKSYRRMEALIRSGRFDVRPVHLLRSPQGVAFSAQRKGRDWWVKLREYQIHARRTRRFLRSIDHSLVRYEELARDPAIVLERLMPELGLAYQPTQLDWAGRERHNCGGNRMRRAKTSEIRLDTGWKSGLTRWQKFVAGLVRVRVGLYFRQGRSR